MKDVNIKKELFDQTKKVFNFNHLFLCNWSSSGINVDITQQIKMFY